MSRSHAGSYKDSKNNCLFCVVRPNELLSENESCYASKDAHPVTPQHTLIIPKRHVADYFGLHQPELNSLNSMLQKHKDLITKKDKTVTGFNIGMNNGEDAGQTVFHCHVHLIPRRKGDIKNPRGGVRGIIPSKKDY